MFDELNKKHNLDLILKENKIETIFILISLIPFLKNEIIITDNKYIYPFIRQIFNLEGNKSIKINKNSKIELSLKFKEIIHYKWEDIPDKNKTNYIRHILYHYYPEECLQVYETSLNLNIKSCIDNNKDKLNYNLISDLMSKNKFNLNYR